MKQITSIICRILFVASFILAGLGVLEKLVNFFGYTLLRVYDPWRLLELSAVAILLVIALQLREIKLSSERKALTDEQ